MTPADTVAEFGANECLQFFTAAQEAVSNSTAIKTGACPNLERSANCIYYLEDALVTVEEVCPTVTFKLFELVI